MDIHRQGSVVVQGGSDEGDAEARMRRDKIKEVRVKRNRIILLPSIWVPKPKFGYRKFLNNSPEGQRESETDRLGQILNQMKELHETPCELR